MAGTDAARAGGQLPLLHRHPLITAAVIILAITGLGLLVLFLLVVPMVRAAPQIPGQLGHAYVGYFNGVGQEFQQAKQAGVTP